MPGIPAQPHHASKSNPNPKPNKLSKEAQADLDALNTSIDRLRTFTAPDPYILTIPQDVEPRYHHAYQYQATQWLHQTPFEWKEGEYAQYQTYCYHEHGRDMFVLHNSLPAQEEKEREKGGKDGVVTGKGGMVAGVGGGTRAAAGVGVDVGGPKKKMSLTAYKKKLNGNGNGNGTPAVAVAVSEAPVVKAVGAVVKQAAVKGPVERVRKETEEVLAAVAEAEVEEEVPVKEIKKELKRKREDKGEEKQAAPSVVTEINTEPVAKKARTASPPPAPAAVERKLSTPKVVAKSPQKAMTPPPQVTEEISLPPKLSPLLVPSLPPRLSPTIPTNIAATIKAREHFKTSSSSDTSAPLPASQNGMLTPNAQVQIDSITKKKSPIPRNAFRANSSSPAVRSDAEERPHKPAVTSAPQRIETPELELSQDDEIVVGRALKARKVEKGVEKERRVVKLKYKKHQREAVRRILKMRPNAVKSVAPVKAVEKVVEKAVEESKVERSAARRRDPNAKGVAQKIGPPAKRGGEQRRPDAEKRVPVNEAVVREETPAKRQEDKRSVAEKRAPVKEAASEDVPAKTEEPAGERAMKPEMKRYEPPGRRRESSSTAATVKPVQERPPKSAEPPDKREDSGDVGVKSAPERLAKVQEVPPMRKEAGVPEQPSAKPDNAPTKSDSAATKPADPPSKLNNPPAKRKQPPEADSEEPPAKRKKGPDSIEISNQPNTPPQSDLLSPSLQKSQQVTPTVRRDHLSAVAMVREHSTDGSANTPSSAKSSTPTINGHGYTSQPNSIANKAPSSQPPVVKTATQQAWEAEQKRLEVLGRDLKHAASAHLNKMQLVASDPQAPSAEQKLAAVKSLESLLAYFLAFTSADQAALAAEPKQSPSIRNWRTLHGFFAFVKRNCEAVPVLLGLACHLGVVYSAHILELTSQTGNKQVLLDTAVETHGALFKNAREADVRLDCDGLVEHFPRTWEGRSKSSLLLGVGEEVKPGGFAGGYKLPLGVQSSPLRAARAGYAMLEEWTEREKVGYAMKLKL